MGQETDNYIQDIGRFHRNDLSKLFTEYGWDLAQATQGGVLCCDVGYGAEIDAFSVFNPHPFVATEPSLQYDESASIQESLNALVAKYPTCEVIRDDATAAVALMLAQNRSFSLITRLYMFPEDGARYGVHTTFFQNAASLLTPGGILVASVEWVPPEASYGTDLIRAGFHVFLHSLGWFVDAPDVEHGIAGGIFIVAQRPV